MKRYFELEDEADLKQWLADIKSALQIPTSHPDVTATYREHLDAWGQLETWQKEELVENYDAELNQVAADSTNYCEFAVTPEELRNLSCHAFDDFSFFVGCRVPREVIREGTGDFDASKAVADFKRRLQDARDRDAVLQRIERLGQ